MSTKHWSFGWIGIACILASASVGQAVVWTGANGGDVGQNRWSQAGNWDAGVPTASDKAYINDSSSSKYGAVFLDDSFAAVGSVVVVGNGSSNTGKLTVYSGSSLTADLLKVGDLGADGFVTFKPGSTLTTNNNDIRIGASSQASSYGHVHFEGTATDAMTATINGAILVGSANAGDLVIEGATVNATSSLHLGLADNKNANLTLMEHVSGATGTLTVGLRAIIGDNAGTTGTVNQTANTVFRSTTSRTDRPFRLGEAGNGIWNMAGGVFEITGGQTLGMAINGGSTGTFNMSGGTMRVPDIIAGGGTATFDFSGGEIFLPGDRVGFAAANAFFDVTGETGGYSYFEMYDNGNNETRLFYAIPEPATLGVLCLGGTMMMVRRRRK